MPAIQSTYATTMRPAIAGMKGDMRPEDIVSRLAEVTIGFGVAAYQGTGDRQVRTANGTATLVGVTLIDQGVVQLTPPVVPDQFTQYDDVPVMKKGSVWVLASVAVVAGAPAYAVNASGVFTNVAAAGTLCGTFMTSAAPAALVLLSVNLA
jgi:hypothetical protein